MATYLTITHWRHGVGDSKQPRQNWQEATDYFATWEPPEGLTLVAIYGALDLRRTVSVWETDEPALMTVLTAQYLAWGDTEVVPVLGPEKIISSMATGGLIKPS